MFHSRCKQTHHPEGRWPQLDLCDPCISQPLYRTLSSSHEAGHRELSGLDFLSCMLSGSFVQLSLWP